MVYRTTVLFNNIESTYVARERAHCLLESIGGIRTDRQSLWSIETAALFNNIESTYVAEAGVHCLLESIGGI